MKFRPCIDLHQGKVKQIVGSSLTNDSSTIKENFVSTKDAGYYANLYKQDGLTGGHIIMLGPGSEDEAVKALTTFPGAMQIGGGIHSDNAQFYLDQGASHVIVTSYVFKDGNINFANLKKLLKLLGKEKLVLDLSCKEKAGRYYVVTDRWQKFSDYELNKTNIAELEQYCDEFLIHAADIEGMQKGVQQDLLQKLADWISIPATYAGGAKSLEDMQLVYELANGKIDLTIGSALDIFGGNLPYKDVINWQANLRNG